MPECNDTSIFKNGRKKSLKEKLTPCYNVSLVQVGHVDLQTVQEVDAIDIIGDKVFTC